MSLLQFALLCNALFSISCGLYLLFYRKKVALLFGKEKTTFFLILGIALILFSITVFVQVPNPAPDAVLSIIVQDVIWVVLSLIILLFKLFKLSSWGYKTIGWVALIVFVFAIAQSAGIYQLDLNKATGMKQVTYETLFMAPKQKVWKIISDVGNYHKIAPNIDSVEIVSGKGEGMVRRCRHQSDSWTEVATLWEEGEAYAFEVDTQAPDYPYPLTYLKGTWKVIEVDDNTSKVSMTFDFSYKSRWQNLVLHPFMKAQFDKICTELLENWRGKIEH